MGKRRDRNVLVYNAFTVFRSPQDRKMFSTLGLPAVIVCTIMGAIASSCTTTACEFEKQAFITKMIKAFIVAVLLIIVFWESMSAFSLFKGALLGYHPIDLHCLAKIWKNLNMIVMGVSTLGVIIIKSYMACGVNLAFNAIVYGYIHLYMRKLEDMIWAEETAFEDFLVVYNAPRPRRRWRKRIQNRENRPRARAGYQY